MLKKLIKQHLEKYGETNSWLNNQLFYLFEENFENPNAFKNGLNAITEEWGERMLAIYKETLKEGNTLLRKQISDDIYKKVEQESFDYDNRHYAFRDGVLKEEKQKRWVFPFAVAMGSYLSHSIGNTPSLKQRVNLWKDYLRKGYAQTIYPAQTNIVNSNKIADEAIKAGYPMLSGFMSADTNKYDVLRKTKKFTNTRFYSRIVKTNAVTLLSDAWRRNYKSSLEQLSFVQGFKWELSPVHPAGLGCECESYAIADFGLGVGVYPIEIGVPNPPHYGCMCTITPVLRRKQ